MKGIPGKRVIGLALCTAAALTPLCGAAPAAAAPAAKKPAKAKAAAKMTAPKPAVGGPAFVDNTPLTEEQKIVHILDRLGFGARPAGDVRPAGDGRPGDVERVKKMGLHRYIEMQLAPEKIDDTRVEAKLAPFVALAASPQELAESYEEGRRIAREVNKLRAAQQQQASAAKMDSGEAAAASAAMPGEMPAMTITEQQAKIRELLQQQGRRGTRAGGVQLQMAKVIRAVESERQLNEVLVDFWSNHFNIDIRKGQRVHFKIVDDREVIRPHVLGKFRDLLAASAKSPAMLFYLDNAQSQVPQPVNPRLARRMRQSGGIAAQLAPAPGQKTRGGINENYAREIMELHTLGVDGGYTQKDVQEVARCLTGWGIDPRAGAFQFIPRRHDNGEKIVLGRHIPAGGGIQDGETVLDILAAHPSTAKYISRKLCQRFVSDEPPAALVERCAAVWKKTDGDLRAIVRTIVTSREFFSRAAYKQKIKSPFEFAVSAVRALGGEIDFSRGGGLRRGNANPGAYLAALGQTLPGQIATMGQPLFQYQAPTGYPEDSRKWVSSGALLSRLNFTLGLVSGRVTAIAFDPPVPVAEGAMEPAKALDYLTRRLLHGDVSPSTRATLLKQIGVEPGNPGVATDTTMATRLTALVLGSPEFQRR